MKDNPTLIPTLIASLISVGATIAMNYFIVRTQFSKSDRIKAYQPLIENIFKPFHHSLERKLFCKIYSREEMNCLKEHLSSKEKQTPPNQKEITKIKRELRNTIDFETIKYILYFLEKIIAHKQLEFLLSEKFLLHFNQLLSFCHKLDEFPDKKDKVNMGIVNDYFKSFSAVYLLEQSSARKSVGLKQRGYVYKIAFKLYPNIWLYLLKYYGTRFAIFCLLNLLFFIVLLFLFSL